MSRHRKARANRGRSKDVVPRRRVAVGIVAALVLAIAAAGAWWVFGPRAAAPADSTPTAGPRADFGRLAGRWQRPDGGYVIEIRSVADSGAMEAA